MKIAAGKPLTVALCGVSGTGKNTLADGLVEEFPELFYQLRQYTTRDRRPGEGDTYEFVDFDQFEAVSGRLVGRTEFHRNFYGTLYEEHYNKINVTILNTQGLRDFLNSDITGSVLAIGLDSEDFDHLGSLEGREHRISKFREERKVMDLVDVVWRVDRLGFLDPYAAAHLIYAAISGVPEVSSDRQNLWGVI